MPVRQQLYQQTNVGHGKEMGRPSDIAQGMANIDLRPPGANVRYPRANEQKKGHQIANPPGRRPLSGAEMLQRWPEAPKHDPRKLPAQNPRSVQTQNRPAYVDWDETEFLPLRMRNLPPRQGHLPVQPPAGPERYGWQGPVAERQRPFAGMAPPQPNWFMAARNAATKPTEIVQVGTETYSIVSTLQATKPEDGGMSQGVYVVKDAREKSWVAKHLSLASKSKRERAEAETQALQQVKKALHAGHENINSIHDALLPEKGMVGTLILEYCNEGSLADRIDYYKAKGGSLPEASAFHLMYGIARGLTMIHHGISDHTDINSNIKGWKTICHLDIKPANILLSKEQASGQEHMRAPRVVLADFGCSVTCDDITSNRETKIVQEFGTPGWLPPEEPKYVPRDMVGRYGKPTDVWQMGGVIQAMCLLLFQPDMTRVQRPLGKSYGNELNCLVATCMNADFARRPTALDLCRELKAVMVSKGYQV